MLRDKLKKKRLYLNIPHKQQTSPYNPLFKLSHVHEVYVWPISSFRRHALIVLHGSHSIIFKRWIDGLSLPSDPVHTHQRYHSDYSSSSESPSVTSSDQDYRQGKRCYWGIHSFCSLLFSHICYTIIIILLCHLICVSANLKHRWQVMHTHNTLAYVQAAEVKIKIQSRLHFQNS